MFIPIWLFHTITTVIFLVVLFFGAFRMDSDYDFSPLFKIPVVIIAYLIYWLIMTNI